MRFLERLALQRYITEQEGAIKKLQTDWKPSITTRRYQQFIKDYVDSDPQKTFDVETFGQKISDEIKRQEPGIQDPTWGDKILLKDQLALVTQQIEMLEKKYHGGEKLDMSLLMDVVSLSPLCAILSEAGSGHISAAVGFGIITAIWEGASTLLKVRNFTQRRQLKQLSTRKNQMEQGFLPPPSISQ